MKIKNSTLSKIILLFLLVVIPIAIFSFIAVFKSNQKLENEIYQSLDASSRSFSTQLDNALNNIYISNVPLSFQSNILRFVTTHNNLSDYSKISIINTIREQLSMISSTNNYLDSAHIYIRDMKRVYNSDGSTEGSFQEFSDSEYAKIVSLANRPERVQHYISSANKQDVFSVFITPSKNSDPAFIIEMRISIAQIQLLVNTHNTLNNDLYYVKMNDTPIATNMTSDSLHTIHILEASYGADDFPSSIVLDKLRYYALRYPLPYSSGSYIRLVSHDSLMQPVQLSANALSLFSGVFIIACLIFFYFMYRMVHRPLIKLTNAFISVKKGDFQTRIKDVMPSDFSYLYQAFNSMTENLEKLIDRDYNQKILLQKAELKQLQAQINPHFLYNSFFLLQRMIISGLIEESQQVSEALALNFRYITKNSMDYVTLEEEYEHTKIYIYIQSLRFEKRIVTETDLIPEKYLHIMVPKLILQPILENAYNHGMRNKTKDGYISIRFIEKPKGLIITIQDNGSDLSDENLDSLRSALADAVTASNKHEMSGVLNIQRRLTIYSESNSTLQVSRSSLGGLQVDITLIRDV